MKQDFKRTTNAAAYQAFGDLQRSLGFPGPAEGQLSITGADPVFPNPFRLGTACAAALAAVGHGVSRLVELRGGAAQSISVDSRDAAAAMRGILYFRLNGEKAPEHRDPVAGFYPVRGGRWIYFHCYFPAHRDAALKVLGATNREEALVRSASWDGEALEEAIHQAGGVAGLVRTREEWLRHPQSAAVRAEPLLEITKIGEAPPEPLPPRLRALAGVRVLDLTRVLAGPVCTRTLAEHGADVLRITGAHLPHLGSLEFDYGAGKLSANLDLRLPEESRRLEELVRSGDVFCQSYRPGSLERRGFGPSRLAALRPGLVYVMLDAFGFNGPWSDRRGYDSVVTTVNGMIDAMGSSDHPPVLMPAQPMDYGTGYLLAYGTMVALARRAVEGGSWMVRTSLARVGEWIYDMGTFDPAALRGVPAELDPAEIEGLTAEYDTSIGRIRHVKPMVHLSATPAFLSRPSVAMGTHAPAWPSR